MPRDFVPCVYTEREQDTYRRATWLVRALSK